ncbi:hypothetical protein LCGC14_1914700, partial [marine sediment metagenome]
ISIPEHDEFITERPSADSDTEIQFCRNVVSAMQKIQQLTDRGLKMRIDVERTKTSWAAKKELSIQ